MKISDEIAAMLWKTIQRLEEQT